MNKNSGITGDEPDRQFIVISSDKEAKVVALPSYNVVFKTKLTETSYIVRSDPIIVSNGVCLACYVANGHIVVYSLPSLRPLLDAEYIPLTDLRSYLAASTAARGSAGESNSGAEFEYHLCDMTPDLCTVKIARTFCFSHGGQGLYLCSPSELQRITVSSEICAKLSDMTGVLHIPREMPEAPSKGILKSFFSSATSVDRDELFGESSGKASKGLAKYQPGTTSLDGSKMAAGSAASEAFRAKQALMERGEKLSQVEDATAQMMMSAQNMSRNTEQLADKYKNKKWYQL
jgi:syntaxin-binding protein 5